jgi:hypothetical protein
MDTGLNSNSDDNQSDESFALRIEAIARYVNGPYVQFLKRPGVDFEVVSAVAPASGAIVRRARARGCVIAARC